MSNRISELVFPKSSLVFADLTPRMVAKASGLTPSLQRVWRRRGQLPAVEGVSAKFSAVEAIELSVRYQLSRYGISPSASFEIGRSSGRIAFYFALLNVSGACEVTGPADDVQRFLDQFEDDDALASALAGTSSHCRYLWRGESGGFFPTQDIQSVIQREQFLSVLSLDLAILGTRFGDTVARPLIHVSIGTKPNEKTVRRLTSPLLERKQNG